MSTFLYSQTNCQSCGLAGWEVLPNIYLLCTMISNSNKSTVPVVYNHVGPRFLVLAIPRKFFYLEAEYNCPNTEGVVCFINLACTRASYY